MEPARSASRRSSCHLARRSRGRIGKLAPFLRHLDARKCSPTRQIRSFGATMGNMSASDASDAAPLPRLGEVFFDVRGSARSMRLSWYAATEVAVFSIWQAGTCTGTFRLPMGELERMIETLRRGPGGRPPADPAATAYVDPRALGVWDDDEAGDGERAGNGQRAWDGRSGPGTVSGPGRTKRRGRPIMRTAMTPAVIRPVPDRIRAVPDRIRRIPVRICPVPVRIRPVPARWTTPAHTLTRITFPRRPDPATTANPLLRRPSQGLITAKPFLAVAVAASRPSLSPTLLRPVPERYLTALASADSGGARLRRARIVMCAQTPGPGRWPGCS